MYVFAFATYTYFLNLQSSIWAVIQVDPIAKKCMCSCQHARYMQDLKKPDLRCWHVCHLQENKELLETLEMCDTPQLHCGTKDTEENEYVVML